MVKVLRNLSYGFVGLIAVPFNSQASVIGLGSNLCCGFWAIRTSLATCCWEFEFGSSREC